MRKSCLSFKKVASLSFVNLFIALFIALFLNFPLGSFLYKLSVVNKLFSISFLPLFFIVLTCFLYCAISLFSFPYIHKPLISIILVCASLAQYFMLKYGIIIDSAMIQNIFETDYNEVFELLSYQMIFMVLLFGILPSLLICKLNISYPVQITDYLKFFLLSFLALIIFMLLAFSQYKTFVSIFRNHRDIVLRIIPNNYINGIYKNVKLMLPKEKGEVISSEVNKNDDWQNHQRNTIFVFVIGEAARASNFSLNGYARETNPNLKKHQVLSFKNFYSCGTSTAISVPCIFSSLDRSNFSRNEFQYNDNLLNLIEKSGLDILWIDNNSGCKSVCDGVRTIEMESFLQNNSKKEIHDEEMLKILKNHIEQNNKNDLFIILHQKGSHGPGYYKRTPEKFHKFKPICDSVELQQCPSENIINSYDNTILYTDYFLSEIIEILEKEKNVNTVMFYVSDHGQSLGENGIYLHGMPYLIAPKYQKHIPMIIWLSENFVKDFKIDQSCINKSLDNQFSHDNLFHSILDILKIDTKVKNNQLSLFNECKKY